MKHNPSASDSQYVYQYSLFQGQPPRRYKRGEDGFLHYEGLGELPEAPMTSLSEVRSTELTSLVIKDISGDFCENESAHKEITLDEYREKLSSCGKYLAKFEHFYDYKQFFIPIHCKDRFCNRCAKKRAERCRTFLQDFVFNSIGGQQNLIPKNKFSFVTFTCSNFPSEMLVESMSLFTKWLKRLKQRKIWKKSFVGGVASYEVTKGRDGGWNLHLHVFGHMSYIDQGELQRVWGQIVSKEWTGYIVDIRRVKSTIKSIREICKYPFKAGDGQRKLTIEDRYLLSRAFYGRRMFTFLGSWYQEIKAFELTMDELYRVLLNNDKLSELLKYCLYRGTVSLAELERSWNPDRWRYDPDLGAYIVD